MATESFSKFIATNTIRCICWGIIDFFPNTQCGQCVVVVVVFPSLCQNTRENLFKEGNIASRVQRFWFMILCGEVGHHDKKGVS